MPIIQKELPTCSCHFFFYSPPADEVTRKTTINKKSLLKLFYLYTELAQTKQFTISVSLRIYCFHFVQYTNKRQKNKCIKNVKNAKCFLISRLGNKISANCIDFIHRPKKLLSRKINLIFPKLIFKIKNLMT